MAPDTLADRVLEHGRGHAASPDGPQGIGAGTRSHQDLEVVAATRGLDGPVTRAGPRDQYSPLITKNEPRIVPASFDFWRANLKREASSAGTSMPSESLKPTARFPPSSME